MAEMRFYHITRGKTEEALAVLLEKACARDMSCFVLCDDKDQTNYLDKYLWIYKASSFLPHGTQHEKASRKDNPIILGYDKDNLEAADFFVLYGAGVPDDMSGYSLVADIFSDADEHAKKAARQRWKDMQGGEWDLTYWQQDENGTWQKKK